MVLNLRKCRIGVVGLGYVGLPLAVEFGKHFDTTGFDVNAGRIAELESRRDSTLEVTRAELKARAAACTFTTDLARLNAARSTSSRCRPRSTSTSGRISRRW